MKKLILIFMLLPLFSFAQLTASLDNNTNYIWRGISFQKGLLINPSASYTKNKFTYSLWGNIQTLEKDWSELDVNIVYANNIGNFNFELQTGIQLYTPLETEDDFWIQNSIKASYDIFYGLFDVNLNPYKYGKYFELGFNKGYRYLDVSYNLGYGDKVFSKYNIDVNKAYLTSTIGLSHNIKLNKKLKIVPHINYSMNLNSTYSNQFNTGLLLTK
jgi:hypothetical protein